MKKTAVVFILILSLFLYGNSAIARSRYRTYKVIEVLEKTIILQREARKINVTTGDVISSEKKTIAISRAKRPNLKVGDRVRYRQRTNRLGRTLSPD